MARIEDRGLGATGNSPIVIYADVPDRDGDHVLLAALTVNLQTADVHWMRVEQPGTDGAHGIKASYAQVRATVGGDEAAGTELAALRERYRELLAKLGAAAAEV